MYIQNIKYFVNINALFLETKSTVRIKIRKVFVILQLLLIFVFGSVCFFPKLLQKLYLQKLFYLSELKVLTSELLSYGSGYQTIKKSQKGKNN